MGLSADETVAAKVTVCNFSAVAVEGHNGILKYSDDEVILRFKRKKLVVSGKNLTILEISKEEAFIKGAIFGIAAEEI